MTTQTPLRISCAECQTTGTCEDCLVAFFTTARPAEVVPFPQPSRTPTQPDPLPADLTAALSALQATGLDPEVLDVTLNAPAESSRAS